MINLNDRTVKILLSILILFFVWRTVSQNVVLISLIAVVLILYNFNSYFNNNKKEHFDRTGVVFVPLGAQRYDLRGEPLRTRPIYDCRYDCFGDCYNSNI